MREQPRSSRLGLPSFEAPLEREEEVLDALLATLARTGLDESIWDELHAAAARDNRVAELAFAYEKSAQGRRLRTMPPGAQGEFFYRAGTFFADSFGDELGAAAFLERALQASPGHAAAFSRLEALLEASGDARRLADLYAFAAPHQPREAQPAMMRKAIDGFESVGAHEKVMELAGQLLRVAPGDVAVRRLLEEKLLAAGRYRDVTRVLEQAFAADEAPPVDEAIRMRERLVETYVGQLQELERSLPHVEALLELDPASDVARTVAHRLLESKPSAARAAAALATAADRLGAPADVARYLEIELEHSRGPRRRDVLKKIGILRQDALGDADGALEAYEAAVAIDPSDDELRGRYESLATMLAHIPEAIRLLSRVSSLAKDGAVRSRIAAELGELHLASGDPKRARATFAMLLQSADTDPIAAYRAARGIVEFLDAEGDASGLADALERIGETSPDVEERRAANLRLVELARGPLEQPERAVDALRKLLDTSARAEALAQLEPLYEEAGRWIDLSFVLEERARDLGPTPEARALLVRAATILTERTQDVASASQAWRSIVDEFGPARDALARWIPLLERERDWDSLVLAILADADLAAPEERAALFASVGDLELKRRHDPDAACRAYRTALSCDAREPTSRAALEALLEGDHALLAAEALEPTYRHEADAAGILRILELRAAREPSPEGRMRALEEIALLTLESDPPHAASAIGRALATALAERADLTGWLHLLDRVTPLCEASARAEALTHALGSGPVESAEQLAVARRVGEALIAAERPRDALDVYRRALDFSPASADLLAKLDDLLKVEGTAEERVALYEGALAQAPAPERRRTLLLSIARTREGELGDAAGAAQAYRAILEGDANDEVAFASLLTLLERLGDGDAVIALLEDRVARVHATAARPARARLVALLLDRGDLDRATHHALLLVDDAGLEREHLAMLGEVAAAASHLELERRVLERHLAAADTVEDRIAWLERLASFAEHRADDLGEAISRLREASRTARAAGALERAAAFLERMRRHAPGDRDLLADLADVLSELAAWDALPPILESLAAATDDYDARATILVRLSVVLGDQLDRPEPAWDAAARAFELAPGLTEARAQLATLAVRQARSDDFAACVDAALAAAEPDAGRLWASLTLVKSEVYAEAGDGLAKAFDGYRALLDEGASVDDATRDAAERGLDGLLEGAPPSPDRTRAMRWLFELRTARADLASRPDALRAWAVAEETTLGSPGDALRLFRQALDLDPDDMTTLRAVARLSVASGDAAGALALLADRRASATGALVDALDVELARVHRDAGHHAEATKLALDLIERAPEVGGLGELVTSLLAHGDAAPSLVAALERTYETTESERVRALALETLLSEPARAGFPEGRRVAWYERLIERLVGEGRDTDALRACLQAGREAPEIAAFWERADALARALGTPEPVAAAYHEVLAGDVPRPLVADLGPRAVGFHEEWFEDRGRVVAILNRLVELDPADTWAFDRLKLLYDSEERYEELFALYDRAVAVADDARAADLLEDAAQIAKDFANDAKRATAYLEALLERRPAELRVSASLERLYEKHGDAAALVSLLRRRAPHQPPHEAYETRTRALALAIDALESPPTALCVAEEALADARLAPDARDVSELFERVLASTDARGSHTEARQRAANVLRGRYQVAGMERDLLRALEVELEVVDDPVDRARRHAEIAELYGRLGQEGAAMAHVEQLVLLEPHVGAHRDELARLAARTKQQARYAAVIAEAAERTEDDELRIDLLMQAARVHAAELSDSPAAITVLERVLSIATLPKEIELAAARLLEPLLAQQQRKDERLTTLERLARLEDDDGVRFHILGAAARLATELGAQARAIDAWQGRCALAPSDPDALDGLATLLARSGDHRALVTILDRRSRLDRDAAARRADLVQMARVLGAELGARREAIAAWSSVEELFGPSDDAEDALVELLRAERDFSALATLLERAGERAAMPSRRARFARELGDIRWGELDDRAGAIRAYDAALRADPREERARTGLRALVDDSALRGDAVTALLRVYEECDEWRLTLDLTEQRLLAAHDDAERVLVLLEAARLHESRGADSHAAFALMRRALLASPSDLSVERELRRLAAEADRFAELAATLAAILATYDGAGEPPEWTHEMRVRLGETFENDLDQPREALAAFARVARERPLHPQAALATIGAAAKIAAWDSATEALVRTSQLRGALASELAHTLGTHAGARGDWEAAIASLDRAAFAVGAEEPTLARDIQTVIAEWHRDERKTPEAAEIAFTRALAYDPKNPSLLRALAELQRREKGRPLVESLLRLSEATGGDLDLLTEAGDVAHDIVGDRQLARAIYEKLLTVSKRRWLTSEDEQGAVSSGGPASPEDSARHAIGRLRALYATEGDPARVVDLLEAGASLPFPEPEQRSLLHAAGEAASTALGDAARAISIYERLSQSDRLDRRASDALRALYGEQGLSGPHLELLGALVAAEPSAEQRSALRHDAASLLDGLGRSEEAIPLLEKSLDESTAHAPSLALLARILGSLSRHERLEELLVRQALRLEAEGRAEAASRLLTDAAQIAEIDLARVDRARDHLVRAVDLSPSEESLDALSRLLVALGDPELASIHLTTLASLVAPERAAEVALRRADSLEACDRSAEALAVLEAEFARDPSSEAVELRLAETYRALAAHDKLATTLAVAAEVARPVDARVARLLEAARLRIDALGDAEAAVSLLTRARELDATRRDVELALAAAWGAAGWVAEARALLGAIIESYGARRPKDRAVVHYHLARIELGAGEKAAALLELDAAARIAPANAQILRMQAEVAKEEGKLAAAEKAYRALTTVLRHHDAAEADPGITRCEVLLELSELSTARGDSERAHELLESAFAVAAESELEARAFEAALRRAGRTSDRVRAIEARIARAPSAGAYTDLADALDERAERAEDAFEARLSAIRVDPSRAELHDAALMAAERLGAVGAYADALRHAAAHVEDESPAKARGLWARLGDLLLADEPRGAAAAFERASALGLSSDRLWEGLEQAYRALDDVEALARTLTARARGDGAASVEASYRLAELVLTRGDLDDRDSIDEALDALDRGLDATGDHGRAADALKAAAARGVDTPRFLGTYERTMRTLDDRLGLVDALVRAWDTRHGVAEPMREAIQIAHGLGDRALVEQLLRRYVEHESEPSLKVWALESLATMRSAAEAYSEAVLLLREASGHAEPDDRLRLLLDASEIARAHLDDAHLVASLHEELMELDPSRPAVWQPLLHAYRALDDAERLSELLETITELASDPLVRSSLRFARVELALARHAMSEDEAIAELEAILEEDSSCDDAGDLLVALHQERHQLDDCDRVLDALTTAARVRQDGAAVARRAATRGRLLEGHDRERAAEVYRDALLWAPRDPGLLRSLAALQEAAGDKLGHAESLTQLASALEPGELEPVALAAADAREALDMPEAAVMIVEEAMARSPRSLPLALRLEALLDARGEHAKLALHTQSLAELLDDLAAKKARLRTAADLHRHLGAPDRAAEALSRARELDPHDDDVFDELVSALAACGRTADALALLDAALDGPKPKKARLAALYGSRAELRARSGNEDGATRDLVRAIELGDDSQRDPLVNHLEGAAQRALDSGDASRAVALRRHMFEVLRAAGDFERARMAMASVLEIAPTDRSALRALAETDEALGAWDNAIDTYQTLAQVSEGDELVDAALRLVRAAKRGDHLEAAQLGLERAHGEFPGDERLRHELADLYEVTGAYDRLGDLFLTAAAATDDKAAQFSHLVRAGHAFLSSPEHAHRALDPLEQAHAIRRTDTTCVTLLSDAYVSAGRLAEATEVLETTIASYRGRRTRELSPIFHRLALVSGRTGDRATMLQHMEHALEMDAQNGDVASELAYLALDLQEWDIAGKALRAVTMLKTQAPMSRAEAYRHLAALARQVGDLRRALSLVKRSLDDDPEDQQSLDLQAELQAEVGFG